MTKREAAVVMAYTGFTMLKGDDMRIFYRYLSRLFDEPIYTHQLPGMADEIQKKAEPDFLDICRTLTGPFNYHGYTHEKDVTEFDKEETVEHCTVQVLENTKTGEISVGYQKHEYSYFELLVLLYEQIKSDTGLPEEVSGAAMECLEALKDILWTYSA